MTQQDINQLIEAMKKVFATREESQLAIDSAKEEIIQSVGDFVHDDLLPLYDEHDMRIKRLEDHAGLPKITN